MSHKKLEVQSPFVFIEPMRSIRKLRVTWGYQTLFKPESDGRFSCYVPAFDIYFSTNSSEAINKKSDTLMRSLFDHFFIYNGGGIKKLALQLHKLGFKAKDDAITLKKLVSKQIVEARFKTFSERIPIEFADANSIMSESKMEVEAA